MSHPGSDATTIAEIVIEPRHGWRLVDFRELRGYGDLLLHLTYRGIRARYAQTALGVGWVVIQPVFTMVIFSVVFGLLAPVDSEGVPYPLFVFCGLVPWTFFSVTLTAVATCLTQNIGMITKIYFPRLVMPLAEVAGKTVDLAIYLGLLAAMLAWFRYVPGPWAVVAVPALLLIAASAALGMGLWLSAMAVQYRDVAHAMTFLVQLMMYLSPVIYPVENVPRRFWPLYALNPMVGVISGLRSTLLGTTPMPWTLILIGSAVTLVLLVTGSLYFRRKERLFADVA